MELLITQARAQFEEILSYIQKEAQNQQLHKVEKGIFSSLLRVGLTLLSLFLEYKGIGHKGKLLIDKNGVKRFYHSVKHKAYHSIFGKINIARASYWAKGCHEVYPLDAELSLPEIGYSYALQEWGTTLGGEKPYAKAAQFLETILGTPLWGSAIETIMNKSCVNVPKFYENREKPEGKTEEEILVVTMDGKGVVMRKDQIEKKVPKTRRRKMRKIGEGPKKERNVKPAGNPMQKKMSTVIGVYTVAPHKRAPDTFLSKEVEKRPRPKNKVLQATLKSKESGTLRLKKEAIKRDPKREKPSVALVDGEHKLRKLIKKHLPWFTIIIDIYHVMEYLWKGAHIFHRVNSVEAERWMKDKLTHLLNGKVEEVIEELKEKVKSLPKRKGVLLQKVITYLTNGKEHMRYDLYIAKGYPVGSGVVEGACKTLVKDRMEQCGMRWTIDGAEAALNMRSIQINKMTDDYWQYHIAEEKQRLYGDFIEENIEKLAA
ncbi:MAG: ISKra4 family transposase [Candidatus Omnitrophica bacterium]|nr:ISKra4 family transposase [Candidatus Omnitrophota bacterium]